MPINISEGWAFSQHEFVGPLAPVEDLVYLARELKDHLLASPPVLRTDDAGCGKQKYKRKNKAMATKEAGPVFTGEVCHWRLSALGEEHTDPPVMADRPYTAKLNLAAVWLHPLLCGYYPADRVRAVDSAQLACRGVIILDLSLRLYTLLHMFLGTALQRLFGHAKDALILSFHPDLAGWRNCG